MHRSPGRGHEDEVQEQHRGGAVHHLTVHEQRRTAAAAAAASIMRRQRGHSVSVGLGQWFGHYCIVSESVFRDKVQEGSISICPSAHDRMPPQDQRHESKQQQSYLPCSHVLPEEQKSKTTKETKINQTPSLCWVNFHVLPPKKNENLLLIFLCVSSTPTLHLILQRLH